jgi:potassium-transporting ATPase KdpC subunit
MRPNLRPALMALLVFTLLTGVIYPLTVTGLAQVFFHRQANGELIIRENKVLGSELIGQYFDDPKYFWSRPSATSPYPYNASASSGSNLAQGNPILLENVQNSLAKMKSADPANLLPVPIDLVTASASGLDPHISLAAAEYQVQRVARIRGLSETNVNALVQQYTENRQFGFLGEPVVNVLKLNLALDGFK